MPHFHRPPKNPRRHALRIALALSLATCGAATRAAAGEADQAQPLGYAMPAAANVAAIREFIDTKLDLKDARVEVEVGRLDPRLRLKPCDRVEPFVPTGARLYGRSHVGLRCNAPSGWTVYLPVNVRVYARVPIAARLLASGETLRPADVIFEEREISSPGAGPFPSAAELDGRVLARGFIAGQAITATSFRPNPVVANGDPVKVVVVGDGFAITTSGVALSQAEEGQPLRVKLESGKTVQGVARAGKRVELAI